VFSSYAERQTGENGDWYRDWVCIYSSPHDMEKCGLESHVLDIPEAFETSFVWGGGCKVRVCSSLAMNDQLLLLPDYSEEDRNLKQMDGAFSRVIRERIQQDIMLGLVTQT
jgi:hypothetical protein